MSPMISAVSWSAGPTSAPVIPKTFHNPGTAFSGGGGAVNGSTYFDGSGDALNLGQIDNTPLDLGALTNFTLEGWWKASTSMSLDSSFWNALFSIPWHGQTNVNSQIWVGWAGSAYGVWNLSVGEFYIGLYMSDGTYQILNSSNTTLYNDDAWHHFALVKNGTSYSLYVDGVRTEEITTSQTLNTTLGTKIGYIGGYHNTSNGTDRFDFNGYVSNVRVSNTARYSGTTFALPNSSFTSDANTLFLTCQNSSGAITDASSNNRTITAVGNAIAHTTNPFGSTSGGGYGSAYFDGTGDSLDVGTFTIGTNPFTIESWFQPKFNTSGSDTVFLYDVSSEDIRVTFKSGNIRAQLGSETQLSYSIGTLDYNTWYYTALQRDSSGNVNFYFDGAVVGNYSASGQNVSGNTLRIGDKQAGSKEFHGYISNFRIVRGNALYPPANGGSASFDGTGDSIDISSNIFYAGTGDFTMEGWIYPTTSGLYDGYFSTCLNTGASGGMVVAKDKFFVTHGGGSSQIGYTTPIENNVWSHIVLQRSSNVFSLYVNGILQGTTTVTVSLTGSIRLGSRYTNTTTYQLNGFLSNFRVVTGTTVYSSTFTPPTSPLTAISGTQLLTCQNGTGSITDASSNNYTITTNGNASASGSSPFAKSTTPLTDITNTKLLTCNTASGTITDASSNNHTVTTNGNTVASGKNPFSNIGSTAFDGGEDYLKFPSAGTSNNLQISTNDFTLEFWIKANSFTNGGVIYDTREGHANSLMVNFNTSGNLRLYANSGYRITADSISTGVWHHYAIVRDSGTTKLFLNGIQDSETYSDTNNYTGDTVFIGRHQSGVNVADFNGYISNLRLVTGTALYPPASDGGSAYFDGAGDYTLTATDSNLTIGSNNFTAECWIHPTTFSNVQNVIDRRRSGDTSSYDWTTYLTTSGEYAFYANGSTRITSSALTVNKWYHTAVVRNINTGLTTLYIDGVSQGTYADTNSYPSNQLTFGMYGPGLPGSESLPYTGYISNFRLIIGTAANNGVEYASNFAPPTSPLTKTFHTEFMTFQNYTGSITDESNNGISITANGDVSASYSSPFIESKSPLTAITNTKLLTCNKGTGAITDESSIGHSVHVNSNAQTSTENPFYS